MALSNYTDIPVEDDSALIDMTFFQQTTNLAMNDYEYTLNSGALDIEIPELNFNPPLHES